MIQTGAIPSRYIARRLAARYPAEHLAVLALAGITLAELALYNFHKIPFTCSYLPGKSNLHITFALCLLLGINAVYWSARLEYKALTDRSAYLRLISGLFLTAALAGGGGHEQPQRRVKFVLNKKSFR